MRFSNSLLFSRGENSNLLNSSVVTEAEKFASQFFYVTERLNITGDEFSKELRRRENGEVPFSNEVNGVIVHSKMIPPSLGKWWDNSKKQIDQYNNSGLNFKAPVKPSSKQVLAFVKEWHESFLTKKSRDLLLFLDDMKRGVICCRFTPMLLISSMGEKMSNMIEWDISGRVATTI